MGLEDLSWTPDPYETYSFYFIQSLVSGLFCSYLYVLEIKQERSPLYIVSAYFFLLEVKGASKKHFPSALPAISKKDKSELNYNRVKQLQNAKISFFPLPINLIRFDKKTHP